MLEWSNKGEIMGNKSKCCHKVFGKSQETIKIHWRNKPLSLKPVNNRGLFCDWKFSLKKFADFGKVLC